MIHLKYIFVIFANVMEQLRDKYERFKAWQIKPHEVVKLSAEKHVCATCGTEFHGNYCPRCGQKAAIGRYSFKSAFLLFLDVWGLGNRGMFRTIRDLLLRPGYMIRDYLSGMQMAYFPPFKMFFLVVALSVFVESGFNIKGQNIIKVGKEKVADATKGMNEDWQGKEKEASIADSADAKIDSLAEKVDSIAENTNARRNKDTISVNGKKIPVKELAGTIKNTGQIIEKVADWIMDNETIFQFLWLIVLSGPMYLFFRHNPRIPDIRYSEFFVSMVYITNMMTIINTIGTFFIPGNASIEFLSYALSIVPLKQLTGYSYKRSVLKAIGAMTLLVILGIILAVIMVALGGLAYYMMDWE